MSLYETLRVDFAYQDERGKLVQLVHDGYRQINILYSGGGTFRGKHYHKVSSEAFYVISGSVNVELSRGETDERAEFKEGDFFLIPPYTVHSLSFPENCVMAAMYDVPIEKDNGEKDILNP